MGERLSQPVEILADRAGSPGERRCRVASDIGCCGYDPDNQTTSNTLPLKQPPVGWCVAGTPENMGKK